MSLTEFFVNSKSLLHKNIGFKKKQFSKYSLCAQLHLLSGFYRLLVNLTDR